MNTGWRVCDDMGGAQPDLGLESCTGSRMLAADIGVDGLERRAALSIEKRDFSGGRTSRDLSLADDRFGDGLDGDRFGQARR